MIGVGGGGGLIYLILTLTTRDPMVRQISATVRSTHEANVLSQMASIISQYRTLVLCPQL